MLETVDWSKYEDVWIDPDRMSGAPCLRATRLPVDTITTHFDGYIEEGFSPQTVAMMIADLFPSTTPEQVLRLMAFLDEAEQPQAA